MKKTKTQNNIIGKKYGQLTILGSIEKTLHHPYHYLCLCDCGKKIKISKYNLFNGNTKSCGCLQRNVTIKRNIKIGIEKSKELIGKRFGRLIVMKRSERKNGSNYYYICKCDCDKEVTTKGNHLRDGNIKSCGCFLKESAKKWAVVRFKGSHNSKETKKKKSEWHIANPNRKFKDTKIELIIEKELSLREINYEKQVPLCKIAIVDFYLPEYGIIIQADGDYWHNLKGRRSKDKKQDKILKENGYKVYRFWEHSINKSVEKCINKIKEIKINEKIISAKN